VRQASALACEGSMCHPKGERDREKEKTFRSLHILFTSDVTTASGPVVRDEICKIKLYDFGHKSYGA